MVKNELFKMHVPHHLKRSKSPGHADDDSVGLAAAAPPSAVHCPSAVDELLPPALRQPHGRPDGGPLPGPRPPVHRHRRDPAVQHPLWSRPVRSRHRGRSERDQQLLQLVPFIYLRGSFIHFS